MKLLILLSLFFVGSRAVTELDVKFEWKQLTFSWPNETFKNESINNGDYIPEENSILGLAIWKNKAFVTIPRWHTGIPATLAYFDLNSTEKSPDLIPYPAWENHDIKNYSSNTIVMPRRANIDSCNRLWLADEGKTEIFGDIKTIGPPTLIVIDLETDEIIRKFELKAPVVSEASAFGYFVIDVEGDKCDDAYAYITDLGNFRLITYSYAQNDAWAFKHNFFFIDPLEGNFWFQGLNFQLNDAIYGVALGPRRSDGDRVLYFHAYISPNEFSVDTSVLKNSSAANHNDYYSWRHEGNKGDQSCSIISAFDEPTNTLITAVTQKDGIACWNPKQNLQPNSFHVIAQDYETLAFPSDLFIDADRNLWVVSDRLPLFLFSSLNYTETNYRILSAKVDDLIAGTGCDLSRVNQD